MLDAALYVDGETVAVTEGRVDHGSCWLGIGPHGFLLPKLSSFSDFGLRVQFIQLEQLCFVFHLCLLLIRYRWPVDMRKNDWVLVLEIAQR